jgi:hypothetical protein
MGKAIDLLNIFMGKSAHIPELETETNPFSKNRS